jgi:prolipoprotein diacylglyceryltransferase
VRPILFSAGGYDVHSAHAFAGLAAFAAYLVLRSRRRALGLSVEELWELLAALGLGVFAGSLGFYLLFYGPGPEANLDLYRRGGLPGGSFLGCVLGALGGAWAFASLRAKPLAPLADALAEAAALALPVMRAGCLLHGCCGGAHGEPTQVYEAAGSLLLYYVMRLRRGALGPAGGFWLFAGGYGALRFAVDFLRGGDPGLWHPPGLTLAQAAGALTAMAAALVLSRRDKRPELFGAAVVGSAFALVGLARFDLVAGAFHATGSSLAAGGASAAHVLGEVALFAAILLLCWRVIPKGFDARRDGRLALAAGLCGFLAEWWGTQLGLWQYYTGERPPLWIVPAWSVGAVVIDRLAARMPRAPFAPLAAFALASTLWLSFMKRDVAPAALLGPAAVALSLFMARRAEDNAVLLAGLVSVFFADLWGTTNSCWRYHLQGEPLGVWQGIAFGMGFDAAIVLGSRKLLRLFSRD